MTTRRSELTGNPGHELSGASAAKNWEISAALRAFSRAGDHGTKGHPAEQILDAALELVHETGDLTVKAVTERAGVALQTFYRHFGTKDELLLAVMEENIGRGSLRMLEAAAETEDPVERLRLLVTRPIANEYDAVGVRMLRWGARERQRLTQQFPNAVHAVHEPYREAVLHAIEGVVASGLARSQEPELDATIIQQLVLTMTHLCHGGGLGEDHTHVAERTWELCWSGLAVDGGESTG